MAERLINAVAFEEELEDFSFGGISLIYDNPHDKMVARHTISEVTYLLDRAHTIEAKPVVHAHWEEHREFYEDEGFEGYYYSCSNCGGTLYGDVEGFNFCHCCGAQMGEVVSDNNVGSKTEGVKIPVISMEDVPKLMEEKE